MRRPFRVFHFRSLGSGNDEWGEWGSVPASPCRVSGRWIPFPLALLTQYSADNEEYWALAAQSRASCISQYFSARRARAAHGELSSSAR